MGIRQIDQAVTEFFKKSELRYELVFDTYGTVKSIMIYDATDTTSPALVSASVSESAMTLDKEVTEIIKKLGIPAHIKGYKYLRESILFCIENEKAVEQITKTVYPAIAEKYDTEPACVERSIRNAIEASWKRGNAELMYKLFERNFNTEKRRPTNNEFIATIADLYRTK